MLSLIRLKFGSSESEPPLEFIPSPMVVFVGPNNSGKSLVLREVEAFVDSGSARQNSKLLDYLDVPALSHADAEGLLSGRKDLLRSSQLGPGQIHVSSYHPVTAAHKAHNLNIEETIGFLRSNDPAVRAYSLRYIHTLYTVALDGKTRLQILDPRSAGGELQEPTHVLGRLFKDDAARHRVRDIGFRAFGKYLIIDPTSMARLEVRLSDREPSDSTEEQALDLRARQFHEAGLPLSDASDGVKAYLGLVSAVLSSDHRLMLIDEPEAFLHPPLAKDLGKELATIASQRQSNVLASTHSAHFLMGAIESGADIDIVRLTYDGVGGSARILKSADLIPLMRDPLLRSTGMLSALFHSAAIICEGDLDRAAYAEINRRLDESDEIHCKDTLFLSAHGKDALHRMVAPLRALGIPAVAIADLDIVQDGLLGALLKSCGLPDGIWQAKRDVASHVAEACRIADVKLKKVGIAGAPPQVREALTVLVQELKPWGLFFVPVGELERWLPNLEIAASTKRGWLYNFFEAVGKDPTNAQYVRPTSDDVWEFVRDVAAWIRSHDRLGMPP